LGTTVFGRVFFSFGACLERSGVHYGQWKRVWLYRPKFRAGRVFVHHTSITGAGFKTLNEGDEVSFDVIPSDKGLKAQNVQRVQAP